jgi:hypothetical protein
MGERMPTEVAIQIGGTIVGKWMFEESSGALQWSRAKRSADGFVIGIPSKLHLEWRGDLQPCVSNLRVKILLQNADTELGVAYDHAVYRSARPSGECIAGLEWRGGLSALEFLEKRRNGLPPKLRFECWGQAWYAVPREGATEAVPTVAEGFYGSVNIQYPLDAWVEQIRMVGTTANILVEVPLPAQLDPPWMPILISLEEARSAITRGGEQGWRATIVAARTALEKWQEVEAPQFGPAWNPPSGNDREAWTKEQRREALRWWLHQFCHLAAHADARHWTREDAVFALATLAALVAAREP